MFLVKAGTSIQVQSKKSETHFNWVGWVPYVTKEDRLYESEDVWDAVALHNGREFPAWAARNITEHGQVIIQAAGRFAMVKRTNIIYMD
jgi:hypothetical protein